METVVRWFRKLSNLEQSIIGGNLFAVLFAWLDGLNVSNFIVAAKAKLLEIGRDLF